jgi:hypothetical protein
MSPLKGTGYCLALCGVRSAERSLAIKHYARLNHGQRVYGAGGAGGGGGAGIQTHCHG